MPASSPAVWKSIPVPLSELCISTVLRCGQSFRWRQSGDEWTCALRNRILTLRQDSTHLYYRCIFPTTTPHPSDDDTPALLHDYFNLAHSLSTLYTHWSSVDQNFRSKSTRLTGIRILRQDPWENVVSFICSSNNNISRITGMVGNLCAMWGKELGEVDGVQYRDFPPPGKLSGDGVEQKLRELGFGYRAKYIAAAAKIVDERGEGWLEGLRKIEYRDAHEALLELPGVGPKVADCVCLMSLDKAEAVPVDTHVLQIAQRDYGFGKTKNKSLTKAVYDSIGDHFRQLWGKEAGWAHSVLFTADLSAFKEPKAKTETTTVKTMKRKVGVKKEEEEEEEEDGDVVKKERKTRGLKRVKVVEEVVTKKKVKTEVKREDVDGGVELYSLAERVKARSGRRQWSAGRR